MKATITPLMCQLKSLNVPEIIEIVQMSCYERQCLINIKYCTGFFTKRISTKSSELLIYFQFVNIYKILVIYRVYFRNFILKSTQEFYFCLALLFGLYFLFQKHERWDRRLFQRTLWNKQYLFHENLSNIQDFAYFLA